MGGADISNPTGETLLHASCVALNGAAVLILGRSGAGKSGLALELMALGAALVADDRVRLWREGNAVMAAAPETIAGRIEARFVGILAAEALPRAPVALIVDLDSVETERLPPWHGKTLLGLSVPLLHNVETRHFPAAIVQYLKAGRHD